ncbi:MAG: formyltransferase family protein [Dokdonella sp.]
MKKLTVMAMTEKGYAVVKLLLSRHPGLVDAVIGARDDGNLQDFYAEISALCRVHGVTFHNKRDGFKISSEYVLAVSWRWLIDTSKARLIVLHDSLLPRYRGFNSLVTALINGDTEVGVTAIYAGAAYDRGDIIGQSSSPVAYPMKIRDAIRIVIGNYEDLAERIAISLTSGRAPVATPQSETGVIYSLWRDEDDYAIDWSLSAVQIEKFVDAVGYPYKGASSIFEGRRVRFQDVRALDDVEVANRTAGKVIFLEEGKPIVVCGQGLIRIDGLTDDETGVSMLPLSRFRVRFLGSQ